MLSVIISYKTVKLSKSLDIHFTAFEKIGVDTVLAILKPIEVYFENNGEDIISNKLPEITETLLGIDLFMLGFVNLYKELDPLNIFDTKDTFTDLLYNNPTSQLKTFRGEFYAFRSKILHEMYMHAKKSSK